MRFDRRSPDVYGLAHPKALLKEIAENGEVLQLLGNQHIVSSSQFDGAMFRQLLRLAAKFESNPERYTRFNSPLSGKILINAFYEPSTRTRLSFDSAWHRLGGDTITITDRSSTGIAKGESLEDVAEMFNNYGDCVVLRDNHADSVHRMMGSLRIPIVNAGNGTEEHPTQAMADLYAILKARPELAREDVAADNRIQIGIVGIPRRMRTVRSLLKTLTAFPGIIDQITLIHDHSVSVTDLFDPGQREELEACGLPIGTSHNLKEQLPHLDVIYINAIVPMGQNYETLGRAFHLTASDPFKEGAIVLHPLARGEELDVSLDTTPHNWYFAQARGAVFLRMALLTCLVERAERVMDVI
ncbi:MAG: aspartate carbamoyltransferase [Aphanocapsa feldmannii 277cV]|uniref:Aspartate carbamoyltransferase n=2 Tax=Aphanocapsa feldmannii TaxID=192050 RepID=A0A524RML6_9CHRO|nr:MAG: aspartate carbamoyltransferase [Aphanocapsa feldmannii 288cV]TGG91873.1 MAG: aspartate carbamoyltransferase [Aphanocapsa feldmannii 277cV]TGH22731.1 MAG: aspartate carbamoyltransferase [Aphanocapsa feldmannii 277cI]